MEVKIEVSDEQFQKIVKESIESLPQEKLHEVVLSAIKEYLTTKDVLDNLFTYKSSYYGNERKPSLFLENIMSRAETTEAVNDIRDDMLMTMKKNNREIIEQAFIKTFLRSIFQTKEFNDMAYMSADAMLRSHIETNHMEK
jgi:hypothetical protein